MGGPFLVLLVKVIAKVYELVYWPFVRVILKS